MSNNNVGTSQMESKTGNDISEVYKQLVQGEEYAKKLEDQLDQIERKIAELNELNNDSGK